MTKTTQLLALLLLAAAGCAHAEPAPAGHAPAGHAAHEPPRTPTTAAKNPVQAEMRLLGTALENAVRGIGEGDVRAVEHDLHRVHAAKHATEAAVHSGAYRLPKNPERVARFKELDEAFHGGLERLADASRRNDLPATADALGVVLHGCQGCHTEFRD